MTTETETETEIERVRVLHGHTSPETAYVVDDYPYGGLRCKIRYWIETATKGAKKGQQRFMRQTTNPKAATETWNKPKGSTYALMAVLYLDGNDHADWWGIGELGMTPHADARARFMGIYDQLTDEQRATYDLLVRMSQRYARPWQEWEERVAALAELMATGEEPKIENGCWITPAGHPRYLFDAPACLAAARQRLAA